MDGLFESLKSVTQASVFLSVSPNDNRNMVRLTQTADDEGEQTPFLGQKETRINQTLYGVLNIDGGRYGPGCEAITVPCA